MKTIIIEKNLHKQIKSTLSIQISSAEEKIIKETKKKGDVDITLDEREKIFTGTPCGNLWDMKLIGFSFGELDNKGYYYLTEKGKVVAEKL
ncbi:hypothetical protein IPF86_02945 [Candidatus Nomurabacteria bacterium]|nr:MAG: hypothetical protein IPF86_02945 [Candidatus Nomurabacteria bacterium]